MSEQRGLKAELGTGAAEGAAAAGAVVLTEATLTPIGGGSALGRSLVRCAAGAGLAYGLRAAGAPATVARGAFVGPVMLSVLDLLVAALPHAAAAPPQPPSAALNDAGEPWAPDPLAYRPGVPLGR